MQPTTVEVSPFFFFSFFVPSIVAAANPVATAAATAADADADADAAPLYGRICSSRSRSVGQTAVGFLSSQPGVSSSKGDSKENAP